MTYMIKEIFGPTIQGEGSYQGAACHFIRFAGCNRWSGQEEHRMSSLCYFCDTDFKGGTRMTKEQIIEKLDSLDNTGEVIDVVISGGEPTLQLDENLCEALTTNGYRIHLETNGSNPLGRSLGYIHHISMSPKQAFDETRLEGCHDMKILFPYLNNEITYEKFESFPHDNIFFQPLMNKIYSVNIEQTIRKVIDTHGSRVSLQTHKIMGLM